MEHLIAAPADPSRQVVDLLLETRRTSGEPLPPLGLEGMTRGRLGDTLDRKRRGGLREGTRTVCRTKSDDGPHSGSQPALDFHRT